MNVSIFLDIPLTSLLKIDNTIQTVGASLCAHDVGNKPIYAEQDGKTHFSPTGDGVMDNVINSIKDTSRFYIIRSDI